MPLCVEIINLEKCVGKEVRLSGHTIGTEGASEVIYDSLRGLLPSGNKCREHVVAPFSTGDTVETEADTVCAPNAHNPSCKSLFPVLCIIFRAFCASFATGIRLKVISQMRV
jgi:hypothetical protein